MYIKFLIKFLFNYKKEIYDFKIKTSLEVIFIIFLYLILKKILYNFFFRKQ